MDSHGQGLVFGEHKGAHPVVRGFKLLFSETTKDLMTIDAKADRPVLVRFTPVVEAVFDAGTTNVLTVGKTGTADAFLAAGDVDETALGVGTTKSYVLREKTVINTTYAQTGDAAEAGSLLVIIEVVGMGRGLSIAS